MDQLRKLTDIRCETGSEDSAVSTIGSRRRSHGNHGDTGHHFDLLKRFSDGCVRILLNNVNGIDCFGNKSRESIKMEKL